MTKSVFAKVLRYEFLNLLRNRWVFLFGALLFALTLGFIRITGDFQKSITAISALIVLIIPLVGLVFTTVSWYYSERFTQLLLTLPIPRKHAYWGRFFALNLSLSICFGLATALPFVLHGHFSVSLALLLLAVCFLTIVSISLGIIIGVHIQDRIKGIGAALGLWLYFAVVHDSGTLLLLIALRDYPMDLPSAIIASLNPMGLTRVVLILQQDASLLLGHTGALVREFLLGAGGIISAALFALVWVTAPGLIGLQRFLKKDF